MCVLRAEESAGTPGGFERVRVMSTTSCLSSHAQSCTLTPMAFFLWSICLRGLPLCLLPPIFPSIVFSKESWVLVICRKEDRFSFVFFTYCMFQDESARGLTHCSPFWQSRVCHVANYRWFGMKCSCFLDNLNILIFHYFKYLFYLGEGRKGGRKTSVSERNINLGCFSWAPRPGTGTKPAM